MNDEDLTPNEIRNVSFPSAVRGYNRSAVDSYVRRVNRVIAELQVGGSPRAAVRHALEQVGEQTSTILQRARETAEEITSSARQEAEETTARAKAEAAEIILNAGTEAEKTLGRTRAETAAVQEDAEARLRELNADIAETLRKRGELLDEVHSIAVRLEQEASRAAARFAPHAADEPGEPTREPERKPAHVEP